jgi:hypothetical protein
MRENRRTGRLALAVAAATLAGLLTAWADPTPDRMDSVKREITAMVDAARSDAGPKLTVVDQALPVARTIVSKSQ